MSSFNSPMARTCTKSRQEIFSAYLVIWVIFLRSVVFSSVGGAVLGDQTKRCGRSYLICDSGFNDEGIFFQCWQHTTGQGIRNAPSYGLSLCCVARKGMQPAVQYLAGELRVDAGEVLPVLATHNTVRLRFDIEEAEYLHLAKPDAAFPANHFSMLADSRRNQARKPALDQDNWTVCAMEMPDAPQSSSIDQHTQGLSILGTCTHT